MSSHVNDTPPTYLFGRRDRGGLLLGFRAVQLLMLGLGVAGVLLGLLAAGEGGGLAGLLGFLVAAFAALFPIQGRPLIDWVRPIANYGYLRVTGQARYLGGPRAVRRCRHMPRLDLPGLGQQLRVLQAHTANGPVAVLRVRDRWTVVLQVRGSNYVLADRASQERRVSAWGALLSQAGQEGSHIAGLQWLERTVPDNGHALQEWWAEKGDEQTPYAGAYADLIRNAGPAATRHETFVAVSIDALRMRRAIRQAGGGPEGTTKALLAELAWIRQALVQADIEVVGEVGPNDLARLVRTQFDPSASEGIDRRPGRRTEAMPIVAAGPMASEAGWNHFRSDSGLHAVYWIAEWPAIPVEAAWCYPLLALGGIRRTVSVSAEPIPPSRSLREVRGQRVTKRADDAQRQRMGQVETAQDDAEFAALERREQELVRGHTEYRFTGWVAVTADHTDELEAACAQVEQACVRSALEVRRVYGEVDQAFAVAALPLNEGVHS